MIPYGRQEITDTDIMDQLLARFDEEKRWEINNEETEDTDAIINDITEEDWGDVTDTAYPDSGQSTGVQAGIKDTDLAGSPFQTSTPQKTKNSRYKDGNDTIASLGFLDNDDDEDNRRRLIGEFINGKTRVVEKATKE